LNLQAADVTAAGKNIGYKRSEANGKAWQNPLAERAVLHHCTAPIMFDQNVWMRLACGSPDDWEEHGSSVKEWGGGSAPPSRTKATRLFSTERRECGFVF
jgi:hypothetical protein